MKLFFTGEGGEAGVYRLVDPDEPSEAQFEFAVVRALTRVFQDYRCIVFGGTFRLHGQGRRPDLALIARDWSHWFIVEVELYSHSLESHVLPQVRAFVFGVPQTDCAVVIARELRIEEARARTIVEVVPRGVVVIANRGDAHWRTSLSALSVKLIVVQAFRSSRGEQAYEVDGMLDLIDRHIGFAKYFATDRSLRLPGTENIAVGEVQIYDQSGVPSAWRVSTDDRFTWIRKSVGTPSIPNAMVVQIIRSVSGQVCLRIPI